MLPQLRGQDELSGFLKTSYASKKFVSLKIGIRFCYRNEEYTRICLVLKMWLRTQLKVARPIIMWEAQIRIAFQPKFIRASFLQLKIA